MSKKKTPKDVFHGSAGGSFAQKKRVVLGNVKHSGDERDISLSKSGPGDSVYSDVDSLSGNNKDVGITGVHGESLLDSAATTPKAKRVDTGIMFGSPLGSPDFTMDDDEIVEVSVKKSFALDIDLLAVEGKSAMAKTQVIRKLFSGINGFGGATTPSKFEGIIRSTFMSEENMEKAALLAKEKGIIINSDLKKQEVHSDWAVVIKEIPMDTPKEMIVAAVSEFGDIKSIKIQLIGMWQKTVVEFAESEQAEQLASKWFFLIGKDSVRVAKAVGNRNIWVSRDRFRVLLFTLPVRTTVHDLNNLLNKTSGRTCIINHSLNTGNRVRCAVVGFKSKNDLNSTFLTEPTRLDLVWCRKCGCLGHLALECDVSDVLSSDLLNSFNKRCAPGVDCLQLAKLYAKKNVPISRPAVFGGKSWAQVVSLAPSSGGSPSGSGFGTGSSHRTTSDLGGGPPSSTITDSSLNARLASLECSLKLLADQVSNILRKLSFVELVPMVLSSGASLLVGSVPLASGLDSNMALDGELALSSPYSPSINMSAGFNSSCSKVLTTKVGGLESKMSALEALIGSVLARLDLLCAGLDSSLLSSSQ
ncbi:hypothetical protein G9A89_015936 [Geosiphon pyriformis]|nr:hypothetical protein G9A89_015936 [Geosiphon pyriformis]